MKKTSLCAVSVLIALVSVLSSCVGARTEADPDRHPDAWKRREMRHFYDSRHENGRHHRN